MTDPCEGCPARTRVIRQSSSSGRATMTTYCNKATCRGEGAGWIVKLREIPAEFFYTIVCMREKALELRARRRCNEARGRLN